MQIISVSNIMKTVKRTVENFYNHECENIFAIVEIKHDCTPSLTLSACRDLFASLMLFLVLARRVDQTIEKCIDIKIFSRH